MNPAPKRVALLAELWKESVFGYQVVLFIVPETFPYHRA